MEPIQNVHFINGDINNLKDREKISGIIKNVDLVLSDIAPNITGIEDVDQANFVEIFDSIVDICSHLLKIKGILVMKFFNGSSCDLVKKRLKGYSVRSSLSSLIRQDLKVTRCSLFVLVLKTDMIVIND